MVHTKILILIAFFLLTIDGSIWSQTEKNNIEVVVYRPKSFRESLTGTRIYVNDSLAMVSRNGKYGCLKNVSRSDLIVLKFGRHSDTVKLSELPNDLEKIYLRVSWQHPYFIFTEISLLPIYETFALKEVKKLEPRCD